MSNWQGYFFKSTKNNAIFPMNYIQADSYTTLPNSREEIKAYRDDNSRKLHRVTAKGHKTSITFKTLKGLYLDEKMHIQKFFTDAEALESDVTIAKRQRKLELTYWNDEDNEYKTSYFYCGDIKFTIMKADSRDIIYNECEINLVEY